MKYILPFGKIKTLDKTIVGGKGFNLSRLWQKKFTVPQGFVVTTLSFDQFFKVNTLHLLQQSLNLNLSLKDCLLLAKDLRKKIKKSKLPKILSDGINKQLKLLNFNNLAVRSSATIEDGEVHSFAGQFESYINVKKTTVPEKIIDCFTSLFSPRVIIYTHRKKIPLTEAKMAVVIHQMINPDIAGNLFTVNFLNKNKKQMLIETVKGSGDQVTAGTGKTQRLLINKNDVSANSLGKIALKIEKIFKAPQEIEWAIHKNKIYILQSRPISFF